VTRRRTCLLAPIVLTIMVACDPSGTFDRTAPEPRVAEVSVSPTVDVVEPDPVELARERTGFHGKIDPLSPALSAEMRGTTWKRRCPVPLEDLRVLHFNYWGFNGVIKRGPLVTNADVAQDLLWVFRQLFAARFPIKRVGLSTEFVAERFQPTISSNRSVTASFNCRPVVTPLGPGDAFSQHAFGLAIDINPVQNPFVTSDGFVRNTEARPYVDRSEDLPGMIHPGDVVVRSFAAIGWEWGGNWSGGKDYMHFSLLGR